MGVVTNIYSLFKLSLVSARHKGVNCVGFKLLHCEYKASRGVDYQNMSLQCIVFSVLICSQHAIEMDLVSQKVPKNPDSNDSSPIFVSLKTKVIQVFLHQTQPEQTIDMDPVRPVT